MVLTLLAGAAAAALGSAQPHPARWPLTGGSGWAADPTPTAMTSGAAAALKTDDAGAAHAATQQEAGPGRLPTLGWNSWNFFKGRPRACPSACSADRASADGRLAGKLDEDVVRSTAEALVKSGLAAKGYRYGTLAAALRTLNP